MIAFSSTFKSVPFLTPEELQNQKEEIRQKLKEQDTWALKEGFVQRYLQIHLSRDAPIIDMGTGPGTLLRSLHEEGFTALYGLDINNFLADDVKPLITFTKCNLDFDRLPWPDQYFQAVIALELFEHLENPFHFIREIHRILQSDGVLILSTPNPFHIWNRIKFLLKGDLEHWHLFNDHISVMTHHIFQKSVLKYFSITQTVYRHGYMPYFSHLKLPRTEFWGRSVCYFMKPKRQ